MINLFLVLKISLTAHNHKIVNNKGRRGHIYQKPLPAPIRMI